jgi:glycosyltransferase involved in cell wall biosynthesis
MRIVYFIPVYPKISETFVLQELYELEKHGFDGLVLAFKSGEENKEQPVLSKIKFKTLYLTPRLVQVKNLLKLPGITLRYLVKRPRSFVRILAWFWQTRGLLLSNLRILFKLLLILPRLKEFRPQLVVCHYGIISADVATILSFLLDVPFGCILHTYDMFVDNLYLSDRLRRASFVIVRSRFSKNYLKDYLEDVNRVRVIHPGGIDTDFFRPILKNRRANRIIAIGRLVEQKGLKYLIKACFLLKKKGVKFRCQIIGVGPEEKQLRAQTKKLGLEKEIEFLGLMVHDKKFLETFRQVDVFVLPSVVAQNNDRDILANSMCEAMACGLPVITTKTNAVDGFIKDGENGFLVPEADSGALARCIEKVFGRDQGSLRKIGAKARQTVLKNFSKDKEIKKFFKIINQAVENYQRTN